LKEAYPDDLARAFVDMAWNDQEVPYDLADAFQTPYVQVVPWVRPFQVALTLGPLRWPRQEGPDKSLVHQEGHDDRSVHQLHHVVDDSCT
jgi:hypothetical protein